MLMITEKQACVRFARHIWIGRPKTCTSESPLGHSNDPPYCPPYRPLVDVAISICAVPVCLAVCGFVLRVHALSAGVEHFAFLLSNGQRPRAAAVCGAGE